MKKLFTLIIFTILLFLVNSPAQAERPEGFIGPLSPGGPKVWALEPGTGIWTGYETIQLALDNVVDGGTIFLEDKDNPTVHTESLSITRAVSFVIVGESEAGIIVQADAGGPVNDKNAFTINASGQNITFQEMTIRNGDYGIRSSAGNINVLQCTFYHNGWDGEGLPDPQTALMEDFVNFWNSSEYVTDGGAMRIENSAGSEIAYCTVYDNDRGIRFQDGDNGNIHNNVTHDNIESGIYLASSSYSGATGCTNTDVNENESYGNMNNGILSLGGHTNTIRNNNVYDNWTSGIASDYPSEITIQGNTINNNNVYGFTGEGTQGENHGGIFMSGSTDVVSRTFTADVLNNIISNNNSGTGTDAEGIRITSSVYSDGIEIAYNTFTNHDIDILVQGQADTVVIHDNKLDGGNVGVQNDDVGYWLDATYNWWGHASGPGPVGPGTGDEVSGYVDYSPFYNCIEMNPECAEYDETVYNVDKDTYYYTIQAAIDDADSGNTIQVGAGTYPEYLHITTDGLTIEGAGIDASIIDLEGLTPYWHYVGCSSSFASRAGVLITGYESDDQVVENIVFRGFTITNAGLNPPITATGTHTDPNDAATLTDANASWTPGELVDQWIHNYGDRDTDYNPARSYGQIIANTETTVTVALSGGVENDWDTDDPYLITPYQEFHNSWWIHYPNYDWVRGISISNANDVLIQNCKITNNGYGGISTGYARCVTTHKYSENITIDNCIVTDHQRAGINIGNNVGAFAVTNNVCERNKSPHYADATREYCGYGIQASGTKNYGTASGLIYNNECNDNGFIGINVTKYTDGVTIKENTVTGHNLDADGAGIFMYHWGNPELCTNHDVNDNTVTGNIRGIVAYYVSDSVIQNNTITTDSGDFNPGQGAIKLDGTNNVQVKNNDISCDGTGISLVYWEDYGEVSAYNNTFTGNTITDANFAGIYISGDAHDNLFTDNTITGTSIITRWAGSEYEETQGDGVFIDDDAGSDNVFTCNRIYENDGDGMENQTAYMVDAENNWWGSDTGPGGVGGGLGDEVSANVDYFPWLLSPEDCEDYTQVAPDFVVDDDWSELPDFNQVLVGDTYYYISINAFSTIQEAVNAASDGNSIRVLDGTYEEAVTIDKADLMLQSLSMPIIKPLTTPANHGAAIYISVDGVTVDGFEIDGTTVCNNGIYGWDTSDLTIKDNVIHGAVNAWDGCGILLISWGNAGTVYGNLIKNNEIYDTGRMGIMVMDHDASDYTVTSDNIITGNIVYDTWQVKWGDHGGSIQINVAKNCSITDNIIYDSNDRGVYMFGSASGNEIAGNTIAYNPIGMQLWISGEGGTPINWGGETAASPTIRANNIYDNDVGAISSNIAGPNMVMEAAYNFWGDVSGPNDPEGESETDGTDCPDVEVISNTDGLGNAVSENVRYCAWLTTPACTSINPCREGDLNYDGCVNMVDLAILASRWLDGCE